MTADASISGSLEIPKIAIGAVVLDEEHRVVLVRRARPPLVGRWSLPGGRLEFGERIEAALRREIFEETGLEIEVGPLIEIVEVIEPPYHYVILDYVCRRTGGELRAGDDAADVVSVRPEQLKQYGVTEAVDRVVTKALTLR